MFACTGVGAADLVTGAAAHGNPDSPPGIAETCVGPRLAQLLGMAALETTMAFIILIGCVLRPLVLVEKDV